MILNRKNNKHDINQEHVINEVIKALKNLIFVVDKENQSLRIGKVSALKNIIEEKVTALQAFTNSQNIIENFLRQDGTFKQESSSMNKLQKLLAELSVVNRENDVLIRSNLEVSNILVEMYKENKTDVALFLLLSLLSVCPLVYVCSNRDLLPSFTMVLTGTRSRTSKPLTTKSTL